MALEDAVDRTSPRGTAGGGCARIPAMRAVVAGLGPGLAASVAAAAYRPASPSPSPGRMFLESRPAATPGPELCGLLARCGLAVDPAFCPAALSTGVKGVTYDDARCAEARDLRTRGLDP